VIVTNAHVVKDMNNLIVVTSDGHSYPGKATNIDEDSDLALVKIDASGLPTAALAAPGDLKVGDTVAAIGTPISFALRNSVTVGIVSGIDRSVNSQYQLIQTDAAINPGNSGGALINMKGEVVGINTMKYASAGVDNLGFAIPIDTVSYVIGHFQKYGKVKRPYLGVELEESWEAVVGLPSANGLRVAYVDPDSPAAKIGIKEDDLLLAIGGTKVNTMVDYHEALKKYLPGDNVDLTLQTGGTQTTKTVTLGEDTSEHSTLTQTATGTNLDADHGKTKIGDSHLGWSMKYPAGLIKSTQSGDGNSVNFADAKGEFALRIMVEDENGGQLSVSGLFGKITDSPSDIVLEKRFVKQEGGASYAKLVAKTSSDAYYQTRAYQQSGRIYIVTFYVQDEEAYTNKFKQNSYNDLLDSFQPSFDKSDAALKDISVFKAGGNTVTNDYGLSVELPADWDSSGKSEGSLFTSKDRKQYVAMAVTSASSGDTLAAWLQREIDRFQAAYAADYRTVGDVQDVTVAGSPAKMVETSSTMGGTWSSETTVLFIKDKYKYEIEIGYPKDGDGNAAFVQKIVDSIKLDKDSINPALGFIQDVDELIDPDRTISYHSDKYKYTVAVPEIWTRNGYGSSRNEKDPDTVAYQFTGGSLTIRADAYGKLEEAVKERETAYKKNAGNDSEYKYSESDETIFDAAGKKFELQYTTNKVPYHSTEYVFEQNDIVYDVTLRINDAVRTDANAARQDAAFHSMKFGS
jgi:S1-C subfamily serine protease